MKRGNFNRLVRAGVIGAMAFACFYQPAVAAEAAKDISKEINDLRSTIVSVEVWIAPRALESRGEISEQVLRRVGCSYQAIEKPDLDPLLDVLANAGFVEHEHPEQFDTHVAVYLTTRSGAVIPLLLNMEFTNSPSLGKYNGMTPVVARKGLEDDLRAWAAQRKSTKPKCALQN